MKSWLFRARQVTTLDLICLGALGYAVGAGYGLWAAIGAVVVGLAVSHYTASQTKHGFNQWPEPSGPYYDKWLSLDGVGDYYAWLAREKSNAEPWRTWARWERSISTR